MRVFIVACFVVAIIGIAAGAILDNFVQESAAAAFTETSARI